ncbi:MAG: transposase [Acholeplasmatales bacterium]|nr:transposase [Acholeplasmatales bacterium]
MFPAIYISLSVQPHLSVTYVQNLFDKKVDIKRGCLPEVLAIDEVYVRKVSKYKYCCVLYDPIHHKIIDVLDCRHKNYLIDYFAKIDMEEKEKVFAVSMDLYRNYRDISRLCLPFFLLFVPILFM